MDAQLICRRLLATLYKFRIVVVALVFLLLIAICSLWYIFVYDLEMARYLASADRESAMSGMVMKSEEEKQEHISENILRQASYAALSEMRRGRPEKAAQGLSMVSAQIAAKQPVKAILACITRDDFYGLSVNRYQLEELGETFADYRIVVVENDSSSEYRDELAKWAASNHRVKVVSKTFDLKKRPSLAFLAKMRNFYLDEISKPEYEEFTRLVIFDMDVSHRWPIANISGSSAMDWPNFGARCFNVYNSRPGVHRDTLAFRSTEWAPNYTLKSPEGLTGETQRFVSYLVSDWTVEGLVMEVDSCFGGLAAYDRKAIGECRYDDEDPNCEHVAFNKCIRDRGFTMVLDTSVAIPFHYRKVKEGFLDYIKLDINLKPFLGSSIPGALLCLWSQFLAHGKRPSTVGDILIILTGAVTSMAWFAVLGKCRQEEYAYPIMVLYVLAGTFSGITMEVLLRVVFPLVACRVPEMEYSPVAHRVF